MNSYLFQKKLPVRDSVTQIGNDTSKSGAQREKRDTRDFLGTGTSWRRRCQYQEGKEERKCCNKTQNKANRCFCTEILFKLQDWYSTGHGSHTPPQDNGDKPMMDLAQSLQTWCVRTQNWYEHVAASICADEEELTVAQRPSWYSDTYPETETGRETENRNRQLSVIVNIETDAQTE